MTADDLKKRIAALGFTGSAFAGRINTSHRAVSRWTAGSQAVPGWVTPLIELMEDAASRGHGEFHAAWWAAQRAAHVAFVEWIQREKPCAEDAAMEIEITASDLCDAAGVDGRHLGIPERCAAPRKVRAEDFLP